MTLSDDQRYQEYLRIKAGFQCPECFGVNIEGGQVYWGKDGFQCTDCGCWWTENTRVRFAVKDEKAKS